jgi:hypothetical protein
MGTIQPLGGLCCLFPSFLVLGALLTYWFMLRGAIQIRRWHIWLGLALPLLVGTGLGFLSACWPYGRSRSPSSHRFAYDEFLIGIGGGLLAGLVLGGLLLLASRFHRIHRTREQRPPSFLPDIGPRWSERVSGPEPSDAIRPAEDGIAEDAGTDHH